MDIGKIVIYGCGGHARSILGILKISIASDQLLCVDENAKQNEKILGICLQKKYRQQKEDFFMVALGDNEQRRKMCRQLQEAGIDIYNSAYTVCADSAEISENVTIGEGCFIGHNTYLGPESSVGKYSIINTGSVIEHETVIGDYTHIAPGATICGRCEIGNDVFVGAGSTIIDKIRICDSVVIGAGAVVVKDITESGCYVGCPAGKKKAVSFV